LREVQREAQPAVRVQTLHKPDIQVALPFREVKLYSTRLKMLDAWVRGAPKRLTIIVYREIFKISRGKFKKPAGFVRNS
jgi:hypothetical protein